MARSGAAAGRVVCQQLVCSQSPRRPQAPPPHTLATASVDLLHLGDVRLQGRRALVPVARALKRRRPVVLQRLVRVRVRLRVRLRVRVRVGLGLANPNLLNRQVRRPQVSQVSLVLLRATRIAGCGQQPEMPAASHQRQLSATGRRGWRHSAGGRLLHHCGGTSSLSPKLPMPPMPSIPMPPMPIPPACKSTA